MKEGMIIAKLCELEKVMKLKQMAVVQSAVNGSTRLLTIIKGKRVKIWF